MLDNGQGQKKEITLVSQSPTESNKNSTLRPGKLLSLTLLWCTVIAN